MNIQVFFNRFNELHAVYVKQNWLKPLCFLDWFTDFLLHGASLNDYYAYRFNKLRYNGKREFITYRRFHKIMDVCNQKNKIQYFRDKSLFNKRFAGFLHRESLDLNQITYKQFECFFDKHQEVFIKEVLGFRGSSVKLYSKKETNLAQLYEQLKHDAQSHYIMENRLVEEESLSSFHPYSVNTIRIVTLFDDKRDIVHFMSARIRIGNKGNNVDNFHFAGIGANIDIETGIISSVGYNARDEEFLVHPMTGKQIIGFKMPKWEECKQFVVEACHVVPEVRYVGWDVVLLKGGNFALIEANDNADHDFQQMHYHGLWKEYKKLLKTLKCNN